MEGADIADIYYPAFLINGEEKIEYPDFKPGEKVRMRIIDGSASTSFWMTFGGETPTLVSADGKDIVPLKRNKTFIAVAETYDFIVTIPDEGKVEFKIMAQDGSGTASAFLGEGRILPAPNVPKPDKIGMMQKMAKMKMKMGAPALQFNPKDPDPYELKEKWGMQMDDMKMGEKDHSKMNMKKDSIMEGMGEKDKRMDGMAMKDDEMNGMDMKKGEMEDMQGMDLFSEYNYDYLKSPEKTAFNDSIPVTNVLLNLTGNMNRYIWSLNGVPLSAADKIKIKEMR